MIRPVGYRRAAWAAPLLLILSSASLALGADATPGVQFNRDVRPILSGRCFKCHGPAVHEGELRLDVATAATRELPSGKRAIVPANTAASALIERITSSDPETRMPPADEPALTAAEITTLRQWIAAGATFERHWAYLPPERPQLPALKNPAWKRNDVDAFILARLEAAGLEPAPEAPRATLIRRVSLDLIGLPPSPAEVRAFVNDPAPDAYERLVDRLLASPQYGVRQALAWLDLARYADSDGYPNDGYRSVWPYRDWVVDALNRDLPYDQFTVEQLAGDLLPGASDEQRLASGFHRQTRINKEAGVDPEEFRLEAVIDRVNTTATIWLGATLGCAQCHDHKYDPFTQRDYYGLLAFFNSGAVETTIDPAGKITDVSPRMTWHTPWMQARGQSAVETLVMRELETPRSTHVFLRGNFLTPGDEVQPTAPAVLDRLPGVAGRDRLALARWLTDKRHPLTSRVAVNRLWAQYFGTGLVETLDDFGAQAPACSHPELLDWLATELVRHDWHWKPLHRLIVTSATYRQQAVTTARAQQRDPQNRLLSRGVRLRLPAELVRDNALAIGGKLDTELGGPSETPQEMQRAGRYRRAIYVRWKRLTLDDMLINFDAPSRDLVCARRITTNTPLQALTLLNDRVFLDAARGLAERIERECGSQPDERLNFAFSAALARAPSEVERTALLGLLDRRRRAFAEKPQDAAQLLGLDEAAAKDSAPDAALAARAAWVLVAQALLNTNEAFTRE